jgi:ACS family pantothenate transporter-like MFS transporter
MDIVVLLGQYFYDGPGYGSMRLIESRWRWLFIVDFIITMPVAIYGYIFNPQNTKRRYQALIILQIHRIPRSPAYHNLTLSLRQRKDSRNRVPPEVVQKRGVLGWSLLKRVGMSWEVYALSILALLALDSEMFADNAILNQYLKYLKTYRRASQLYPHCCIWNCNCCEFVV